MGANNWNTCPKCKAVEADRQLAALTKAQGSYGKVPSNDYHELLADAEPRELKQTLREDYELDVDEDGEFTMHYRCSCATCNFSFDYQHSEQAYPPKDAKASKKQGR